MKEDPGRPAGFFVTGDYDHEQVADTTQVAPASISTDLSKPLILLGATQWRGRIPDSTALDDFTAVAEIRITQ
ncbi:hypothetical protein [Rhodanobacter sp. C03]|uniref:hypothetical protein n=1 Tax=Rhodanobacter sp. C03 TaxID=1945858 RepID=UPI0009846CE5|nr:hypothetical protein [Rhodanobacter sp. C03]OOG53545.1 hypothetical protein B0E48_14725 [Rhodanobacter sp. C03]